MTYNVGDTLCNCTLLQKCGDGAYGEVWLAEDAIGTRVALKIVPNGGRYSERELAGLKNYKECNHPNLLKIRYVEITDEQIICIMDAADDLNHGNGEYKPDTLANRLRKYGRLDGKEITDMLDGLLSGLEELHKHGLVHRDIKPDNILWVNGRATLADVGLIAFEGTGSLAGTPGFLSPRVFEGNPPQASDDFYALGKVIYCALTGLAVSEYPSIPADMTISVDANLNKALRTSCAVPVNSTAEFRKLLAGKTVSVQRNFFPWRKVVISVIIATLIGGLFYLFSQKKVTLHSLQSVEIDPKDKKRLAQLATVDQDADKDLQQTVQILFKRMGFLSDGGKLLHRLLQYQPMTGDNMRNSVLAVPRGTAVSPIQRELFSIFLMEFIPDFDTEAVKARQKFWSRKSGEPAAVQKDMLNSDKLMQAVALDAVIRCGIKSILRNGKLTDNDKKEMQFLLKLRYYLLNPEMYKLKFLEKTLKH